MLVPNKRSRFHYGNHKKDVFPYLGYDYHGDFNIMRRVISPQMFDNDNQNLFIARMQKFFEYLIDKVKMIKVQFIVAREKDDINFN